MNLIVLIFHIVLVQALSIDDSDLIGNPPAGLINLLKKVAIQKCSTACCAISISKPAGGYFFNKVI